MQALVKTAAGAGNMELREVPEPTPGPGEVKIRVMAASICGSDLHIRRGDIGIPMRFPVIPGHEFAGVITDIGPGVTGLKSGERVTAENTRSSCGVCSQCAAGSYNLCRKRLATGYAFDGAFTSYVVVPAVRIHRLPDAVDFRSGSLTDPSACAYHAVQELTRIDAGQTVLITGPGPMGLFCVQYAKANGGIVILTGRPKDAARLELGRVLGADHVFFGEGLEDKIKTLCGEAGVDVVIECAGAEAAAQMGLRLLKRQGQYTQVGIFGRPVCFDLDTVLYREIRLTGSFSQKFLGWQYALALCAEGKVKVAPLITHTFQLTEWERAFDVFERGEAIKVVFELGTDSGEQA
jgi:L-iditol 2-dehydrogenase